MTIVAYQQHIACIVNATLLMAATQYHFQRCARNGCARRLAAHHKPLRGAPRNVNVTVATRRARMLYRRRSLYLADHARQLNNAL